MIVIFEGPDGAGKDFARRAFEQANNYRHLCITRAWLSQFTYACLYKRNDILDFEKYYVLCQEWYRFLRDFSPLTVLVLASPGVLAARLIKRGEDPTIKPVPASQVEIFKKIAKNIIPSRMLLNLNTTNNPTRDAISLVIEKKIKKLEEQNGTT